MCAGLTGTAISNTLLLLRQKLDPNFKSQNEAPNVPLNAATWAAHMGISSNVRYQVLNGLDMVSHFCLTPHKESGLPAYSPVQTANAWHIVWTLMLSAVFYHSNVCFCIYTVTSRSLVVPVSLDKLFIGCQANSACPWPNVPQCHERHCECMRWQLYVSRPL